jgi:RNA polymerase sigma factor (sigma-70 family)
MTTETKMTGNETVIAAQAGDEAAKAELVESVKPLIGWWVKRLRWAGDWEDGVSEGVVGVLEALKRFDPEKGVKFSTYASLWIRKAVETAMKKSPVAVEEIVEEAGDADVVVNAAAAAEIKEALKGLTAAEAELLRWRFFEDETLETIGARLGCHKFTASTRIADVLERVKSFLKN